MKTLPSARVSAALLAALGLVFLMSSLGASLSAGTQNRGTIGPTSGPVTWSGFHAAAAAAPRESECVEGVNCDTFILNVEGTPADWAGKQIKVSIKWTLEANDFDLYIHKDSNTGPIVARSADGAPQTSETTAIDPASNGTGLYSIHVVYFSVANDQPQGTATVEAKAAGRSATYVKGGIPFSANVATKAPAARRDGEPSNRTDTFGNHYVAGIRGVPAGTDLWYFDLQRGSPTYDPHMRKPIYRGQPDGFLVDENNSASVGADGGGDIDLAVGFGPTNPAPLAAVSLVAANISAMRSHDAGGSFTLNPVGSSVPIDDRQWIEAYRDGSIDAVYLYYRTISVPVNHFIQRSDDGGLTYGPPVFVGFNGQTGYIDVDQKDGTVYASRQTGSTVTVAVGVPPGPGLAPLSYTDHIAATDASGVNNLFAPVKVAADGTAYVTYSNGRHIYLVHSVDKGKTWSPPVRVSDGPETVTSLFPWIETGALPGSVAIVWYGTNSPTNTDDADWHVFFAQSLNAKDSAPTFTQVIASDHVIHGSNISTGGLLGAANRNLLDYFNVSIDPTGAAVIAYTDDHNDFDGHVYVTRQIGGPGLHGGTVPSPGPAPAPAAPAADGSQVQDFARDHVTGLLLVTPLTSPFDITSIKYSCEDTAAGRLLVTRMKVSNLSATPAGNWRMNFTANAPYSTMSPTGEFTFGLSDRGDQFFLRASTDTNPAGNFTFGTAVRNSNGSLSYTTRGAADSGAFSSADNTITVKVLLDRLTPFVTKGPAIGTGSTLVGLRGQTFTTGVNAVTDIARGGTQYTLPSDCSFVEPPPPPPPPPPPGTIFKVTGSGAILDRIVQFALNADKSLSGHLNYRDEEQGIHLVSTKILTFLQTGPDEVTFSGTGTIGSDAVSFEITVVDKGEPGKDDFFRIEISGARTSSRSGTLSRGNVQVHR
jgi:hypothetical protein